MIPSNFTLKFSPIHFLHAHSPVKYFLQRYASKWIILVIDMMLISLCLIVSYSLLSNTALNKISVLDFFKGLIPILVFSTVGHLIFKPHMGVIRHTSMHDIKAVFLSRTFAFILNIIYITSITGVFNIIDYSVPYGVGILNYFLATFALILFRFGIKYIFHLGKKKSGIKPSIILYGAGNTGQRTYHALIASYNVVAFIDDDTSKKNKLVNGIKILHPEDGTVIKELIKKTNATEVILSVRKVSPAEKRRIVNLCMSWELKIKSIPPIENWVNDQLTRSQIKDVKIEDLLGREAIKLEHASLQQSLRGQTILVTGAAGSIGSEIARQLLYYKPKNLILLDQAETPLYQLEIDMSQHPVSHDCNIQYVLASITDSHSMQNVFRNNRIDWIFHAAAYKHVPAMEMNPSQAIKVNILGTKIIADLAERYLVQKMVLVSTDKAVNPTNIMGASKRAAEMYVQSKNELSITSYITTRFGNVLGSNGSVIPLFKKQIEQGGPVTVTHKDITRYFMTIPEACELVLEAGDMGNGGEIFVFDMGESVKIIDLAKKMIYLSGLIPEKDIKIEITNLRPGEKIYEELLNDKESVINTHHAKIMKAKARANNHYAVSEQIDKLSKLVMSHSKPESMVSYLKTIVPEFKSQNSPYEKLDAPKLHLHVNTNKNKLTAESKPNTFEEQLAYVK